MVTVPPTRGRAVGAVPVRRERRAASAKGVSSMKVYVGNLSYETTEAELRELFAAHGTVESVNLITEGGGRSKGFGFVEFRDEKEANAAIAALNGTEVRGRTINVNQARPKTERGGFGGGGRNRY
jgi:cold-inducible RNA-binding protein